MNGQTVYSIDASFKEKNTTLQSGHLKSKQPRVSRKEEKLKLIIVT
jgi:hypothetical protein